MYFDKEPQIRVGIVSADTISFVLHGKYQCNSKLVDAEPDKLHTFTVDTINEFFAEAKNSELVFSPLEASATFELRDVMIGIGFHWQRTETQLFAGSLSFMLIDGKLWAINTIGLETYLFCVIASEMKATSQLQLLKAHAVVSRSWLLAQLQNKKQQQAVHKYRPLAADQLIRWYDREDHTHFDVCADDHCQRYQGLTRADNPVVRQAIDQTQAQILTSEGAICDARFSKCCGGVSEKFSSCWQDVDFPYLMPVADSPLGESGFSCLEAEESANEFIMSDPDAFCNTTDPEILSQVLNNYDRETTPDFFRWRVEYSAEELTRLVNNKSGRRFGTIVDLQPLRRGPSGRIIELKIVGSEASCVIGKELEIRRWLSPTHLYSSAFVVVRSPKGERFTLLGAGWGHGVGMCQIGAAVMSYRGYDYQQILSHYFKTSKLQRAW